MIERWKDRAKDLSSGVFRGFRAADGRFEETEHGHSWLAFEEPEDVILWCPFNEQIALFEGRGFALNELAIENAATYSLGAALVIHGSIRNWILANGHGIFVVDWRRAFHMLHRAPRVIIDANIGSTYDRWMRCPMPRVSVRQPERRAV